MDAGRKVDGIYPELPKVAVGAVVFHDGRVLLVRRAKPPGRGCWAIPGGSVRLGESLQQAAEREIREETGIVVAAGKVVHVFETIRHDDRGRIRFHYVIIDLAADYVSGQPAAADDAADARWVAPDDLAHLEVNAETRHLLADRFDFSSAPIDPPH